MLSSMVAVWQRWAGSDGASIYAVSIYGVARAGLGADERRNAKLRRSA